ncbi:asparagine synthase-domain-containing protein [Flagelloscypha sp. PMI_526]|nr:asparagine synthase-domain-containing protein [Flagelloscypha sp. PMI_526]
MCGIFVSICPDAQRSIQIQTETGSCIILNAFASELQLRGMQNVIQPHEQDGNVLCWNGEIFNGLSVDPEENDGHPEDIPSVLAQVEGPYALVFYHKASSRLFWARDILGRRSLLIHQPTENCPWFILSSVSGESDQHELREVGTSHIQCLDLRVFALEKDPHVDGLVEALDRAVRRHVQNIPPVEGGARLAVLFSGGIDSAIITYLAHRHVPINEPIDLLNVAFENPFKIRTQATSPKSSKKKASSTDIKPVNGTQVPPYLVPDRLSGLEEVEELRRVCPERTWNFVEINIPFHVSQDARGTIAALMLPNRTIMDMSLAMALYFASRGIGTLGDESYETPARVLLNGLGSDELLGGYSRHRAVYEKGGWPSVISELQQELENIPARNLGRDDRIISSHGKEARHPFLDLEVVHYLSQLPIHTKFDPTAPLGIGDKMLLRLATRQLGCIEASKRLKRAMQFGTRSARMEGESKGTEIHESR